MPVAAPLIRELEEVVHHGSPARRAGTLNRITGYFLAGASSLNDDHVALFDEVLGRLLGEVGTETRSELSRRLASVGNAPVDVVRRLARDDDIVVAGPVLEHSQRIAETDLVEIARTKSQAHLRAISGRASIAEAITQALVHRGDQETVCKLADNRGARLSDDSFSMLVARAKQDAVLAEKVGLRPDIPPSLLHDLLLEATQAIQERLCASPNPETRAEIRRVLAKVSEEINASVAPRGNSAAQRLVEQGAAGPLDDAALVDFAKQGRYEEMIAALASLSAVPVEVVERLMRGARTDPVLVLCKSAGWEWPTVKAILMARPGGRETSSQDLDSAYADFNRLSSATARRVLRFWRVRKIENRE